MPAPPPAPVVVFAYDRPDHLARTLALLAANDLAARSELHVFADGPKPGADAAARARIDRVRAVVDAATGFAAVRPRFAAANRGLAASVIAGVTAVLAEAEAAIVVEDDIATSPAFLTFMNAALDAYRDRREVMSVTGWCYPPRIFRPPPGYPYDAFFSPRGSSWGWGTWRAAWARAEWSLAGLDAVLADPGRRRLLARGGADLAAMLRAQRDGRIDSWAVRWSYSHFLRGAYCLFPTRSFVENAGFDDSGTHCRDGERAARLRQDALNEARRYRLPPEPRMDPAIARAVAAAHRPPPRARLAALLRGDRR